jgi:tetratricopeptide (TPR) repeat protein
MNRRSFLLSGLAGLLAMSTPKIVDKGVELIASANAQVAPIDETALAVIDAFDEDKAYSDLQNGNYDKVINDYKDSADLLIGYDLNQLKGESKRVAGVMFDNVAFAYKSNKEYGEALKHASFAVQLLPNSPSPHNIMGFSYVKLKRWEDALREYNISKDLCPTKECLESVTPIIGKIEKILNR